MSETYENYHKKGGQNPPVPTTKRPRPPMGSRPKKPKTATRKLAEKIALCIMTPGGSTEPVDRLVMMRGELASEREVAGWCLEALADQIGFILNDSGLIKE